MMSGGTGSRGNYSSHVSNFSSEINIFTPEGVVHIGSIHTGSSKKKVGFTPLHPQACPGFAHRLTYPNGNVRNNVQVNVLLGWEVGMSRPLKQTFNPRTNWDEMLRLATQVFRHRILDKARAIDDSTHPAIAHQIHYWQDRLKNFPMTSSRSEMLRFLGNSHRMLFDSLWRSVDKAIGCVCCGCPLLPTVSCNPVSDYLPPFPPSEISTLFMIYQEPAS